MKSLPLRSIAAVTDGQIEPGPDLIIRDIATHAKRIKRGTLFFDLSRAATQRDRAPQNYPYAILTDKPAAFDRHGATVAVVRVTDIREAYWKFVDYYRQLFQIPVIGVTGTCGKTTTKEMVKYILAGTYKVNATYKSYNASFRNLGYLLEIDDTTQAAVYEMGVAFPGDLKTSCRYFRPQVGIITNIGIDHLQAFGSLNAYIKAKAEFLEGLGYQGTLVLNGDDPNIATIDLTKYQGDVIYFGTGKKAAYKISGMTHQRGFLKFILQCDNRTHRVALPGHAEFNMYNAAAAIAAAHAVGLPVEAAVARLASFQNVEKHFEFNQGINGSTIIDDTWSTNPTSAEAALQLLKTLAAGKKTIAVLGKMSLLGKQSPRYHFTTGERVAAIGIDQLIVMGGEAAVIGEGALHKGMGRDRVHFCKDASETYQVLRRSLDGNSIALVKTSMLASYDDLMAKIIVRNAAKFQADRN